MQWLVCSLLAAVLLGLVHILLPMVSALTAVTVLFRCLSSVRLFLACNSKRPLFVFSEVNERSLQLAGSLSGLKCHVVFAGSAEEQLPGDNDGKRGFIFKEEAISQLNIRPKKGKDIYFFCISRDEDLSLSLTLQLIDKFSKTPPADQHRLHIYQFSIHQDYSVFIDSADKGELDIQCVNEHEMLIYGLLNRYPLYKHAKGSIHVLLHGLSPINVIAMRSIAWCGQLYGFSTRISVVGIHIDDQAKDLSLHYPGLFTERYDIRFYNCQNEREMADTIARECVDANYIIVGGESDNTVMNQGILLRRLFYRLDGTFTNCPPIFCHIKDPSKFQILQDLTTAEANPKRKMSYDLIPFGSLEEVYTYKNLVDSDLEKLAKNVHLAYEEIFSDGPIDVEGALRRYNVFEVNKRSNRANALHIRYKLNLLGLDYTDDPDAQGVQMQDYYTDELMDALSISEHDRWMAFLETEGWIPSSREDVYAYKASGISKGRHNCPILKMHPYICHFDQLEELSLELEGKDTRVYDTELILRIPDILGNKWKVADKNFKIIKLQ